MLHAPNEKSPASRRWTADELRRLVPKAKPDYIDALVDGWDAMALAGITTPLRRCHFLAQAMHETGDFTIVRESTKWTAQRMCELWPHRWSMKDPLFLARYGACRGDEMALANLAYGGKHSLAKSLGNTIDPNDGWYFRGGGVFQGTGRYWYREVGTAIEIDLEDRPEQIENPRVSLAAAIWYWQRYKLNRFADRNYIRAIGNQINRGNPYSKDEPIGAKDRSKRFDRAWALFGAAELPNPHDLAIGAYGSDVEALQLQLRELNYAPGNPDKAFGSETSRAIAAFKADWKRETGQELEPDEIVGPLTRAALATASPISRPEREQMTVKDLVAAGSTEAKAAKEAMTAGLLLTATGGTGVAQQTGQLDAVRDQLGWVPEMHSFLVPVLAGFKWFTDNLIWVFILIAGVLLWSKGRRWLFARLEAARRGFNLWR